jgi:multidrug efflux pump subunit AcrA (membrane-fusion protein)
MAQASDDANQVVLAKARRLPAGQVPIGGSVSAQRSVELTAQLPGRVVILAGEEGDHFSKGDLLVALDETELRAQRKTVEAQWATAEAGLRNAGVQFGRQLISPATSHNAPGGMGVPAMFDQVFTNPMSSMMGTRAPGVERHADVYGKGIGIEQARHALEQANAQLGKIDSRIRDARSIAPFDGVITAKRIEIGDTVQPGQALIKYEDLSSLQILADIPARLGSILKEGDVVPARIDVGEGEIKVKLATIFPTADELRHTVRMKFDLPAGIKVAPGTYAEVWLPSLSNPGMAQTIVPASAVVSRGGLPVAFIVGDDDRTELRMVRLGETLANGDIVVLYGIYPDERVVNKPSVTMTSGQRLDQP